MKKHQYRLIIMRTLSLQVIVTLALLDLSLAQVLVTKQQTTNDEGLNNYPVVGVLLQEQYGNKTQYVASSYVKFLESSGARVVPIFVRKSKQYYADLVDQLNGILMPGGGTPLIDSGYARAVDLLLDLAMEKNNAGQYFPIWFTCLSFEKLITYFTGDSLKWESNCTVENVSLNLEFPNGTEYLLKQSKLFNQNEDSGASSKILKMLKSENLTANYHSKCLTVDTFFSMANLTKNFLLLSTNHYKGVHFVSTIEHRYYPFYGTQWHPEKPVFEWVKNQNVGNINHNFHAIQVGQYISNFLVNEARRNGQHFRNASKLANEYLIYNYKQYEVYTGRTNKSSFDEIYRFPINIKLT